MTKLKSVKNLISLIKNCFYWSHFFKNSVIVGDTVCIVTSCNSGWLNNVQFHFGNFFVDTLNKLKHEINQFFFFVFLKMIFRDQETKIKLFLVMWYPTQDLEFICSSCEEPLEHIWQQDFNISLLDAERYSAWVNWSFD